MGPKKKINESCSNQSRKYVLAAKKVVSKIVHYGFWLKWFNVICDIYVSMMSSACSNDNLI